MGGWGRDVYSSLEGFRSELIHGHGLRVMSLQTGEGEWSVLQLTGDRPYRRRPINHTGRQWQSRAVSLNMQAVTPRSSKCCEHPCSEIHELNQPHGYLGNKIFFSPTKHSRTRAHTKGIFTGRKYFVASRQPVYSPQQETFKCIGL